MTWTHEEVALEDLNAALEKLSTAGWFIHSVHPAVVDGPVRGALVIACQRPKKVGGKGRWTKKAKAE